LLGSNFKFEDYYSVFEIEPEPVILTGEESLTKLMTYTARIPLEKVQKTKNMLDQAFSSLYNYL
jgi:hypothetical protein